MKNNQVRLIASAIVVLAGGLTFAIGEIGKCLNMFYGDAMVVGCAMLFVASIIFVIDYIWAWKKD